VDVVEAAGSDAAAAEIVAAAALGFAAEDMSARARIPYETMFRERSTPLGLAYVYIYRGTTIHGYKYNTQATVYIQSNKTTLNT
jgi:hypothetical protein